MCVSSRSSHAVGREVSHAVGRGVPLGGVVGRHLVERVGWWVRGSPLPGRRDSPLPGRRDSPLPGRSGSPPLGRGLLSDGRRMVI